MYITLIIFPKYDKMKKKKKEILLFKLNLFHFYSKVYVLYKVSYGNSGFDSPKVCVVTQD